MAALGNHSYSKQQLITKLINEHFLNISKSSSRKNVLNSRDEVSVLLITLTLMENNKTGGGQEGHTEILFINVYSITPTTLYTVLFI